MTGIVDGFGRALVGVTIITAGAPAGVTVDVWIDTGFNGDLVLPRVLIQQLGMTISGAIQVVLADGSKIKLPAYKCKIHWFGRERDLEVIANDGDVPLLGVGLLLGKELRIDYTNLTLSLVPMAKTAP